MKRVYKTKYSEEQIPIIIKMYSEGFSAAHIGKKFNIHLQTVLNLLRKYNFEIRTHTRPRKYIRNSNYFNIINSHEKAQILGFLYADGCILTPRKGKVLSIHISKIDYDYVGFIKNALQYNGKITNRNELKSISLKINDNKLCDNLIKLGCLPRKSLTLTFPQDNQVPFEYLNSFLLGYLEGDGCICSKTDKRQNRYNLNYRVSFCLTKEFGQSLQKVLLEYLNIKSSLRLVNNYKNQENPPNVYTLYVYGNRNCIKLLNWLYKDVQNVMERKYQKYLDLKNLVKYIDDNWDNVRKEAYRKSSETQKRDHWRRRKVMEV